MKNFLRALFQKILGYDNYLFLFSLFCIERMNWGKYEQSFRYFLNIVSEDGVLLDIGANIGFMSIAMAKKFPGKQVIAFEPIPANSNTIKKIIRWYKISNVQLLEVALGNANEKIDMVTPIIKNSKRQGLSHVLQANNTEAWNTGEVFSVPMYKLDDIELQNIKQKIAAIKMDVENYEFEVLCGATSLIRKNKPIVYAELWKNENRVKCINYFKEMEYSVKIFDGTSLVNFTNQEETNFFFLPNM